MGKLAYSELNEELKDRLNFYAQRQIISKEERQLYYAPIRLARAATEGLLRFVLNANGDTLPHLTQELILTYDNKFNLVKSYKFPEQAFTERVDAGFLLIKIDKVEVEWEEQVSMQEVEFRAKSSFHGRGFPCFTADLAKRRFYAPDCTDFSVVMIRMPHAISDASQGKNQGVQLTIDTAPGSSGDATISDGTNTVTIGFLGSETQDAAADKIVTAVNADTDFYYEAEKDSSGVLNLIQLQRGPLNPVLDPSLSAGGTSIAGTFVDQGTLKLPIEENYLDGIAEKTMEQIASLSIPGIDAQKQQQPTEGE